MLNSEPQAPSIKHQVKLDTLGFGPPRRIGFWDFWYISHQNNSLKKGCTDFSGNLSCTTNASSTYFETLTTVTVYESNLRAPKYKSKTTGFVKSTGVTPDVITFEPT